MPGGIACHVGGASVVLLKVRGIIVQHLENGRPTEEGSRGLRHPGWYTQRKSFEGVEKGLKGRGVALGSASGCTKSGTVHGVIQLVQTSIAPCTVQVSQIECGIQLDAGRGILHTSAVVLAKQCHDGTVVQQLLTETRPGLPT